MKYYAVIDTNVLVSALFRLNSVPGSVALEALEGRIVPLLNQEIVAEYREVLHRPKFKFRPELIDTVLNGICERGRFLDAAPINEVMIDPKDVVFYEVVMEARKDEDSYLVTGNIKHFPHKPFVVTPREMLDILNGENN